MTCTAPVDGCRSHVSVMLTDDGNVFATLSVTLLSACTAPEPMLTAIDPATPAAAEGRALTVECTLACALVTPEKSADATHATRHDRSNHMTMRERVTGTAMRARAAVSQRPYVAPLR